MAMKFASLHKQWWRFYMNEEELLSGRIIPKKQTNQSIVQMYLYEWLLFINLRSIGYTFQIYDNLILIYSTKFSNYGLITYVVPPIIWGGGDAYKIM